MGTRQLQVLVVVCSAVFTVGTALQNFVVVDLALLEHTMRLAGQSADEAARNAPGFLTGFRVVGCVFIVGNAVGLLAMRGWAWVFWVVLAVNVGQAAGVFMIRGEVFEASIDAYGFAGILPTVITDGGAVVLAVVMIVSLVRAKVRA